MQKKLPFTHTQIEDIIKTYPTPFHIYDEKNMIENAQNLQKAFSWNKGFKEFFAVKANPNPYLIKLFSNIGFGTDCSSLAELEISNKVGVKGNGIMFTSNNTTAEEYKRARELNAIINLDDISHISYLEEHAGLPDIISFRYNPGNLKAGNDIIGNPEEAKYGLTKEQLFDAYKIVKEKGITRFGIHTMVASNELNNDYFIETAEIMFNLIVEIQKELDITFEFVNLGGGIGIPYHPEDTAIDINYISSGIEQKYSEIITNNGLQDIKIFLESGRYIAGPYGYLVTRVLHFKDTYRQYVGVDASMVHLMRPGMYGAYHHITVLGKENESATHTYDVTGSLCENNDKFAIQRQLPELQKGDLLAIHDTGAHGHSMGFNYNGKLRSAELLLRTDGSVSKIRRAETLDDYFSTVDFGGVTDFS
ncbi:MAG: diaminopimelate decarboxylase [Bacteroidales bacterium]|jgi:diaminopimelate decarboxylase|nr:diaminopimelate decarboxylase [Bacteroidales bacterium]